MAFQNIVFPNLKLIHGFKESVELPVSIVGNGNSEQRSARMRFDKFSWSYPSRLVLETDKQELYTFYKQVHGATDSFLFANPARANWNGESLESAGTTKWKFSLPNSFDHPLFNADPALVVLKNGLPATWTLEYLNGYPVLNVPGSNAADDVTVDSGIIYFAARFDGPMSWSMEALKVDNTSFIVNMSDIALTEVFEHA